MPTNQKRHTCIKCGAKRVEKYMHRQIKKRFIPSIHWECDECFIFSNHGVKLSSVTWTPRSN